MSIMSQVIIVDNETKRPFSRCVTETEHTAESAARRQAYRRRIGGTFVNGWYVVGRPLWTEYQRFYEVSNEQG